MTHRDVEVAISIDCPRCEGHDRVDTLPVSRSVEQLSLITEAAGDYRLAIRALGDSPGAGTYVAEIDELRPAETGDGHRVAAERSFCEGFRLRLEGKPEAYRRAIVEYERALEAWSRTDDAVGPARTLNALGFAGSLLRDYRGALEAYAAALPFWRRAEDPGGEADTLNNMGFAYHRSGDLEHAIEHYREALETAAGDDRRSAQILNNLARVYKEQVDYERALPTYQKALELRRAADDSVGAARVLVNLAVAYGELQEQRQALDLYHEAIPILRQAGATRSLGVALNNLAGSYRILGQYERAISFYAEALEISRALEDRRSEGRTLNNLGLAWLFSGEPPAALERFEQALELLRADEDRKAEAAALLNAAMAYRLAGELEKALEYGEKALEIKREKGDSTSECIARTELAATLIEQGRIDKAMPLLEQALELSRSVQDQRTEALALFQRARAEQQSGRLEDALGDVEAAVRIVESRRTKVGSPALRAAFMATKRRFYELRIDLLMELHRRQPSAGYEIQALQVSEHARARSLIDMLEDAQVEVDRQAGPELQERERALRRRVHRLELDRARQARRQPGGPRAGEIEQSLETALAELEQIESLISRSSPAYAALSTSSLPEVGDLRQILDPETALLEFALGEARSFLWVLTSSTIDSVELPGRSTIEEAARGVYELLTARERSLEDETPEQRMTRIEQADASYPAAATALSTMLLGSLKRPLEAQRWLLVTEGALSYVPFAALADPWQVGEEESPPSVESFRPLILKREIVRLPSASTLAALRREPKREQAAQKPLVALADPVFSHDDPRIPVRQEEDPAAIETADDSTVREYVLEVPLRRLTFTDAEARSAAAHASDADLLLGVEASKQAVIGDALGDYRIVHFATHGILDDRHPQLSALVLSLFDGQGHAVDGFLRLHDIYNLQLGADLVVLSACQTALGKEIKGEGLVGLTRGFMYAGAPRVLATLWTVQDRATKELMDRFYQRMLGEGERPAAAIRQAQLVLLEGRRFSAPYFWAGFELQGEWR